MKRPAHRHLSDWLRERTATASLSRQSVKLYRTACGLWIEWAPGDPRKWQRRHVIAWLEEQRTESTKRTYLKALRQFCGWMVERGGLDRDPTKGIPTPKVPKRIARPFTEDEAQRLVDACPDRRARAIVLVALQCGLRRAELAALNVYDIDAARGEVLVNGKGGKQRVVPIPGEALEAVNRYLDESPSSGPLFRSFVSDERLSTQTIWATVDRALRDAGVKRAAGDGRTLHACRHTAASDVLDRSGSLVVVKELLGHASAISTEVYTRSRPSHELRDAVEGRRYTA